MRKCLIALGLLAAVGLYSPGTASASLMLRISDGTTTHYVIDNTGAGLSSSGGNTSTVGDSNSTIGAVSYSGSIGSFSVVVAVGSSKPLIGDRLDLFNLDISGGSGTLTVEVTDTDYTAGATFLQLAAGGVSDGLVSISGYSDASNAEFGTGSGGPVLGPFSGAFSGTSTAAGPGGATYSMTISATVTHTGAHQATSFNAIMTPIPEPGSLVLVATGMTFFGGTYWRRRRKLLPDA